MSRWKQDEVKHPEMREWIKTEAGKAYQERHKEYAKQWRKNNKKKFHDGQKRAYAAVRLEALIHYSQDPPRCACWPKCKVTEIEFLQLDHINGDGAKHRREIGMPQGDRASVIRQKQHCKVGSFAYWLKKNGWPKGIQVLCANCNHAKKTAKWCPVHHKELITNIQIQLD